VKESQTNRIAPGLNQAALSPLVIESTVYSPRRVLFIAIQITAMAMVVALFKLLSATEPNKKILYSQSNSPYHAKQR
jgi:hypothetical protein